MITEKEFLQAVDIINKYQIQISHIAKQASGIKLLRTTIDEWVLKHPDISLRLRNALKALDGCDWQKLPKVEYVEDLTRKRFLKIKNAGLKSWLEFYYINNPE